MQRFTVGLVGARGHVGKELLMLLEKHPRVQVSFVVSRTVAGQPVALHVPGSSLAVRFEDLSPQEVAQRGPDAVILALSNQESAPFVSAMDMHHPGSVLVDVSADHRFNPAWVYGLPEHTRQQVQGATRISNPGCYATGAQVGLKPILHLLNGMPHVFGVSGYSGAGSTPNPRNNTDLLRDNLLPYNLTDHLHQREVSHHLGTPVAFVPHVASFFRGMVLTISAVFRDIVTVDQLTALFESTYGREKLIRIQKDIPLPRDAAHHHGVTVGGLSVSPDGRRGAWVVTLDNLLKGAATQAVQNLNLALGLPELEGIPA